MVAKQVPNWEKSVAANLEPPALAAAGNDKLTTFSNLRLLLGALGATSPSLGCRLELVLHLAALASYGEARLGLAFKVMYFFPDGCH